MESNSARPWAWIVPGPSLDLKEGTHRPAPPDHVNAQAAPGGGLLGYPNACPCRSARRSVSAAPGHRRRASVEVEECPHGSPRTNHRLPIPPVGSCSMAGPGSTSPAAKQPLTKRCKNREIGGLGVDVVMGRRAARTSTPALAAEPQSSQGFATPAFTGRRHINAVSWVWPAL